MRGGGALEGVAHRDALSPPSYSRWSDEMDDAHHAMRTRFDATLQPWTALYWMRCPAGARYRGRGCEGASRAAPRPRGGRMPGRLSAPDPRRGPGAAFPLLEPGGAEAAAAAQRVRRAGRSWARTKASTGRPTSARNVARRSGSPTERRPTPRKKPPRASAAFGRRRRRSERVDGTLPAGPRRPSRSAGRA